MSKSNLDNTTDESFLLTVCFMLKHNNDYKLNKQNFDQEKLLVQFKIPFYLDLLLIYYYVNVRFEKSRVRKIHLQKQNY